MAESFERFEDADGASSSQESAGESDEKFRDRYRKSQAAIKKIRKQEGKKKKQDNTLAHIIVQFLGNQQFTHFFVLISRIISKNIPSDIVLAILALIHKESANALDEKLQELPAPQGVVSEEKTGSFPSHLKTHISHWTKNIATVAAAEPHRVLETIVDHNWDLDPNIIEFSAAILQYFFAVNKEDVPPIENLRGFMRGFFEKLVATLEAQVHQQGALGGEVDSDFQEEE